MKTDITYCAEIDCPVRFTCKRNVANAGFKEEKEARRISISKFEHGINGCEHYIKEGAKK